MPRAPINHPNAALATLLRSAVRNKRIYVDERAGWLHVMCRCRDYAKFIECVDMGERQVALVRAWFGVCPCMRSAS